jgi:hypothetical protein
MLETPHVVVGAAIATQIPNPLIALPLALASHFVLDKLPHWNPHLYSETDKYGKPSLNSTILTFIDLGFSLTLGTLIASRALPDFGYFATIMAACLVSALPDIVEAPYFFMGVRNKYLKRWINIQRSMQFDNGIVWGIITQILVLGASFWWILG